jgi:hypothetical protein
MVASITPAERDAERALERVREQLESDVVPAIARLTDERRDAKDKLRNLGVTSSADLAQNYRARAHAEEFAEIVGFLRGLRRKKAVLDRAFFDLEAVLRRVRRQQVVRDAGLTDAELTEVRTTLRRIDVELDDLSDRVSDVDATDIDALIDAEMGS